MSLNYIHGVVAFIAIILLFIKSLYARKIPTSNKVCQLPSISCYDYELVRPREDCRLEWSTMYTHSTVPTDMFCSRPKCKRDPDIIVDDEIISVHPREFKYEQQYCDILKHT